MAANKTRKPMTKSTQVEIEIRVAAVHKMLLTGALYKDILRHATEVWGVTDRQADTYIHRAHEIIEAEIGKDREAFQRRNMARRAAIYASAFQNREHATALEVVKDMDRVTGAYPTERHDHTINGKLVVEQKPLVDLSALTPEMIKKVAAALLEKDGK